MEKDQMQRKESNNDLEDFKIGYYACQWGINIKGKVVHIAKDEHEKHEVGVEFTDKDDAVTDILKKYIKAFNDHQERE